MIEVLDIPLYDLGMKQAVQNVIKVCKDDLNKKNRCISATGAHGLVIAKKNSDFADLLKNFYFNLPDGRPAVVIGKIKGAKNIEQCTGPDFFKNIMEATSTYDIKHYLCGGKEGIAEELKLNCEKRFLNKNIVGIYSPPFKPMTNDELRMLGNEINSKLVDILWIGISTPKQEFFANKISQFINVHFIMTVGAAFDFHTDKIRRAPRFIRKIGMEWFFRLCIEPRRLWKRYSEIVPKFIYYNLTELFTKNKNI
jgi:N-acetylglucosaminyldiphosphoundecaprenol N-acetyl-beta-D-mannosaminyltransferase